MPDRSVGDTKSPRGDTDESKDDDQENLTTVLCAVLAILGWEPLSCRHPPAQLGVASVSPLGFLPYN